jgi:hypothetical protein
LRTHRVVGQGRFQQVEDLVGGVGHDGGDLLVVLVLQGQVHDLLEQGAAWLPLGIRDTFDAAEASTAGADSDIHFAFGDAAKGTTGFRLTHSQALAAQAVALAAGSPPLRTVAFGEVAPVAMMLGSPELLRAWVLATLADLATDDENHARLRDTLLIFLHTGGSYKVTAERLMLHKNTVQYRIRKAEESLGRPLSDNRRDVELALRVTRWLGSSVLQPTRQRSAALAGTA